MYIIIHDFLVFNIQNYGNWPTLLGKILLYKVVQI